MYEVQTATVIREVIMDRLEEAGISAEQALSTKRCAEHLEVIVTYGVDRAGVIGHEAAARELGLALETLPDHVRLFIEEALSPQDPATPVSL